MLIFSPYHQFANLDIFLASFANLRNANAVSTRALVIPHYSSSVRIKLRNSRTFLDNLLAIKQWDTMPFFSPSAPIYSTIGSNAGISNIPQSQAPSTQAMNISLNLDGFFDSLASALDTFAHVVNLAYFSPPKNPRSIGFDYIIDEMLTDLTTRNEPITGHLAAVRRANWYKEMKPFRRCATHYTSIDYQIDYKSSFGPLRGTSTAYSVNAILLPDNPLNVQSTYNKRRRVSTFCVRILKRELAMLDDAFTIVENKIRTAGRIPF